MIPSFYFFFKVSKRKISRMGKVGRCPGSWSRGYTQRAEGEKIPDVARKQISTHLRAAGHTGETWPPSVYGHAGETWPHKKWRTRGCR